MDLHVRGISFNFVTKSRKDNKLAPNHISFHLFVQFVHNGSQDAEWLQSHQKFDLAAALKHVGWVRRPEDVPSTEGKPSEQNSLLKNGHCGGGSHKKNWKKCFAAGKGQGCKHFLFKSKTFVAKLATKLNKQLQRSSTVNSLSKSFPSNEQHATQSKAELVVCWSSLWRCSCACCAVGGASNQRCNALTDGRLLWWVVMVVQMEGCHSTVASPLAELASILITA
jgi:hypothetical protein